MPHFLKRLELNGFKSFAGRVVFEFPAGITAIVGPNGSGKSNVVDSIRWLLGEREARNLRGAKIEDLIFAGTPKRPRMGMAQAGLHFENKNRFFPVEFAEVSIERQISRDGSSRYFLNKSEILLRDLVDFLAKARLGSRGLVVVTQGNSDVFMRATPLERREMIEEMLGLREYQLKKIDAERRLKNSRINLDKATTLIEEILPHLRSLKRQTSRWEKRGELAEELKGLENDFFGSQFFELKNQLGEIEKKISEEKAEYELLEKEKADLEEKRAAVETKQPKEKELLTKVRVQIYDLVEKKNQFGKDLGKLEGKIETGAKESVARPLGEAVILLKTLKDSLVSALENENALRSAVKLAIDRIEKFLFGEESASGKISGEIENQLKKIRQELTAVDATITELKNSEKNLEKGQEDFYRLFKSAVAEVEAAKIKIEKWQIKHRELLFEKERLGLRKSELLRQIEQAGRKVGEFENWKQIGQKIDLVQANNRIFKLRGDLASIGDIDEALMKEAKDTESRYEFLKKESEDLKKAVYDLESLIKELNEKITVEFQKSLAKINQEFNKFFDLMFGGGQARLKTETRSKEPEMDKKTETNEEGEEKAGEEEDESEEEQGGVLIDIKLPRKKINSLEVLSGGERSLVGIAALFAMISVSPPPFLVLDEIDAALDDRNARRFAEMLKEFSRHTQFIVVTHNRATMEAANVLYGVTINDDGASKVLSLKLES